MADELDPVTQQFIADTAEYTADLEEAAATAQEFAAVNEEAKVAVDGLRDSAAEAGAGIAAANETAGLSADELRDRLAEVAAAAGIYTDEMGRLRDSEGKYFAQSALMELALTGTRDEALEAAAALHELGTQAEETAAKLDLMSLSGASSFTSLVPLIGVIGGLVIAGAAVAPAFAAAGLGLGAFGAFAIPTLSAVSTGYQTISKDQQAVDAATTAAAKNTALTKLAHDWSLIPGPIAQVVKEVMSFKAEFSSLAQSSGIQSSVLGDITKGLQMARQLLPEIVPLAQAGARSVSMILTTLSTALQSSGFRVFIQLMTSMSGAATQAIMQLAMVLTGTLGQAIETLMGDSVPLIRFLTVLAQALSGPLIMALHFIISLFLGLAGAIEPLLPALSQIATALIQDIGSSFSAFIPLIQRVVAILGGAFIQILTDLLPVIANALTPNSPFMMALNQLPAILNAIMPLITGFASILANPVIAQAAVWIISLVAAFQGLMGVVGLVGAAFAWIVGLPELLMGIVAATNLVAIATKAWAIAQMLLDLAEDAGGYGLIIIAILALVAVFVLLWTHSAAFRNFWIGLWHDITSIVDIAVKFIETHWKLLAVILATVLLGPVGGLVVFLAEHFQQVKAIFMDVLNWVKSNWKNILGWLLLPVLMAAGEIYTHTHQIAQAFDQLRHDVAAILDGLRHDIAAAFDNIRHDAAAIVAGIRHDISTAWDNIRHGIAAIVDAIPGDIEKAWDTVRHGAAAAFADVLHSIESAWHSITSAVSTGAANVLSFFQKMPGEITSFLARLPGDMLSIGQNIIHGLINGIESMGGTLSNAIISLIPSPIRSLVSAALGLASPSKVFHGYGINIVQGLINGVKAMQPDLHAAMAGLTGGVTGIGSSLAAGAIAPAGGSSVHVSVPTTIQGSAGALYSDPKFQQYLQSAVQEATLRYGQVNPGNGFTSAWGR